MNGFVKRGLGRERARALRIAGFFTLVVALGAWLVWSSDPATPSISGSLADWSSGSLNRMTIAQRVEAARRGPAVYPYSIVPGGVRTPSELREASTHDPIVASHYAGFNFDRARVVVLPKTKLVYLSYRIKDKVYWTKKKVRLTKGEKLITDGKIIARTRCANQVSESAQKAVSHDEPVAENFEQPVEIVAAPAEVPFPSGLQVRPFPGGFNSALPPLRGAGPPPFIGPIGGGGHPPFFPPPPPLIPPKTGVPDAVPGPAAMLVIFAMAFLIYLRRRKLMV